MSSQIIQIGVSKAIVPLEPQAARGLLRISREYPSRLLANGAIEQVGI